MGISWRFVCVRSLVCNLVLQIVLYGKRRHEGKACKWLDAALLLLKTLSPGNSWLNNWFFFCLCVCLSYRIIGLLYYPMGNTWTFFTDCKDPKIIQNLPNERISVYTAFVLVCLVLYYAWKKKVCLQQNWISYSGLLNILYTNWIRHIIYWHTVYAVFVHTKSQLWLLR